MSTGTGSTDQPSGAKNGQRGTNTEDDGKKGQKFPNILRGDTYRTLLRGGFFLWVETVYLSVFLFVV